MLTDSSKKFWYVVHLTLQQLKNREVVKEFQKKESTNNLLMESQRKAWMNFQSLQKKLWLKINKKSFFLKKNKLELIKKK